MTGNAQREEVDLILDGPNGSRARNTFPAWLEGLREPRLDLWPCFAGSTGGDCRGIEAKEGWRCARL